MIRRCMETGRVAPLFDGWEETMIWSCLQGVMGEIYANETETSAVAVLGDFAFYVGEPDAELAAFQVPGRPWKGMLLTPQNDAWDALLAAAWGKRAKKIDRYAIMKEPGVFDQAQLRLLAQVPAGYTISRMNESLYEQAKQQAWSRDLVSNYPDWPTFERLGMASILLKDGEPVAGASSYSTYIGGIEIEIDTRPDQRRKGLATVCAAKLILACMERGLYPSWDAMNKMSLGLAQKLGYHFSHAYAVYKVEDAET